MMKFRLDEEKSDKPRLPFSSSSIEAMASRELPSWHQQDQAKPPPCDHSYDRCPDDFLLIQHEFQGSLFAQRSDDGYVNATAMC